MDGTWTITGLKNNKTHEDLNVTPFIAFDKSRPNHGPTHSNGNTIVDHGTPSMNEQKHTVSGSLEANFQQSMSTPSSTPPTNASSIPHSQSPRNIGHNSMVVLSPESQNNSEETTEDASNLHVSIETTDSRLLPSTVYDKSPTPISSTDIFSSTRPTSQLSNPNPGNFTTESQISSALVFQPQPLSHGIFSTDSNSTQNRQLESTSSSPLQTERRSRKATKANRDKKGPSRPLNDLTHTLTKVPVSSLPFITEQLLDRLGDLQRDIFDKYAIYGLVINMSICKEGEEYPFQDGADVVLNNCIAEVTKNPSSYRATIRRRNGVVHSDWTDDTRDKLVVDRYHKLMDSPDYLKERLYRNSEFATRYVWTKRDFARFKIAFKLYGYGTSANREIAAFIGSHVHANNVSYFKKALKKFLRVQALSVEILDSPEYAALMKNAPSDTSLPEDRLQSNAQSNSSQDPGTKVLFGENLGGSLFQTPSNSAHDTPPACTKPAASVNGANPTQSVPRKRGRPPRVPPTTAQTTNTQLPNPKPTENNTSEAPTTSSRQSGQTQVTSNGSMQETNRSSSRSVSDYSVISRLFPKQGPVNPNQPQLHPPQSQPNVSSIPYNNSHASEDIHLPIIDLTAVDGMNTPYNSNNSDTPSSALYKRNTSMPIAMNNNMLPPPQDESWSTNQIHIPNSFQPAPPKYSQIPPNPTAPSNSYYPHNDLNRNNLQQIPEPSTRMGSGVRRMYQGEEHIDVMPASKRHSASMQDSYPHMDIQPSPTSISSSQPSYPSNSYDYKPKAIDFADPHNGSKLPINPSMQQYHHLHHYPNAEPKQLNNDMKVMKDMSMQPTEPKEDLAQKVARLEALTNQLTSQLAQTQSQNQVQSQPQDNIYHHSVPVSYRSERIGNNNAGTDAQVLPGAISHVSLQGVHQHKSYSSDIPLYQQPHLSSTTEQQRIERQNNQKPIPPASSEFFLNQNPYQKPQQPTNAHQHPMVVHMNQPNQMQRPSQNVPYYHGSQPRHQDTIKYHGYPNYPNMQPNYGDFRPIDDQTIENGGHVI